LKRQFDSKLADSERALYQFISELRDQYNKNPKATYEICKAQPTQDLYASDFKSDECGFSNLDPIESDPVYQKNLIEFQSQVKHQKENTLPKNQTLKSSFKNTIQKKPSQLNASKYPDTQKKVQPNAKSQQHTSMSQATSKKQSKILTEGGMIVRERHEKDQSEIIAERYSKVRQGGLTGLDLLSHNSKKRAFDKDFKTYLSKKKGIDYDTSASKILTDPTLYHFDGTSRTHGFGRHHVSVLSNQADVTQHKLLSAKKHRRD
jgi:hypothetical protein